MPRNVHLILFKRSLRGAFTGSLHLYERLDVNVLCEILYSSNIGYVKSNSISVGQT